MFHRLKAVVPFITTLYLAAACLLSVYLPWNADFVNGRRIFDGYAWLWKRQGLQAHLDWATLADEYLALLLAFVCLLGSFYCLQIVVASEGLSSITGWLRRVLRLPAIASVPPCAAYLLAAAFLAAYVPVRPPQTQSSSVGDDLGASLAHPGRPQQSATGDGPWNDYAPPKQTASDYWSYTPPAPRAGREQATVPQPAAQPVASLTWGQRVGGTLRGSLGGSRLMFLREVLLFLFTLAVYVGLAGLFQRRRRTRESGAK